jgi:hypothetical protein
MMQICQRPIRARRIPMVAGLGVAMLLAVAPAAQGAGARVPGPCALPKQDGEAIQHYSKRLIRCAAAKWPVPGGAKKAICIARHESGLVPSAESPTGRYLGLFQHSKTYWPGNYKSYTHKVWQLKTTALNGRSNAVVSVRMAHDPDVRWRPWAGTGC